MNPVMVGITDMVVIMAMGGTMVTEGIIMATMTTMLMTKDTDVITEVGEETKIGITEIGIGIMEIITVNIPAIKSYNKYSSKALPNEGFYFCNFFFITSAVVFPISA